MFEKGIFIVGVRKCGTTSLFDVLAQHSQISPAKHKEPQFFCMDAETVNKEHKWYEDLFDDKKKWLLDGSTLYYQYPASYSEIHRNFNDTKFIICLRDPAKRFFSAYWHMKAKPQKIETRSLREIIDSIKGKNQGEIIKNERTELEKAAAQKKIEINYLNEDYHYKDMMAPIKTKGIDPYAFFEYYKESLYSLNYSNFTKENNTHVLFFEDLLKDPKTELEKVHQFLGLPVEEATSDLRENINKTMAASNPVTAFLSKTVVFTYLKSVLTGSLKYQIKKLLYKPAPNITAEEYDLIKSMLKEEYQFWGEKYPQTSLLWKF